MTRSESFQALRRLLFGVAYRILHSVSDAEDVCQEAWLRYSRVDSGHVHDPRRFLTRVVVRLALDRARSNSRRREEYVGPWLPEPLPTQARDEEHAESLSMAFLLLLETLSPVERTVFLLRQVFDIDYLEISEITGKTPDHCRQILKRSRAHLAERRSRFESPAGMHEEVMARFGEALRTGDLSGLLSLLAEDVVLTGDGGGKATAARIPIHGAEGVARFLLGVLRKVPAETEFVNTEINGALGVVTFEGGKPTGAMIFEIHDERIQAIYSVRNPDKLEHLRR